MVSKSRKSKLPRYKSTKSKSRTSKKMTKSKSRKSNLGGSNSKITPNRATKKIQDAARKKIAQKTKKKTKAAKKILTKLKNLSDKRPMCGFCLEKVFDGITYTELCGPNHPFHRECVDELRKKGIKKCPICRQISPNDIDIPV